MRRIVFFCVACVVAATLHAQHISRTYNDVSLADALRQLNEESDEYTINFLYNELEDFRITTTVRNKLLPEAIEQMIGFYPINVNMMTDESGEVKGKQRVQIYVECIHKTERRLTGRIVDEDGMPVAYANIALLDITDSTIVTGGVSNESGQFVIPYERDSVVARISCIGYKTLQRLCTTPSQGVITLEAAEYIIDGVAVKARRTIVRTDDGHITYDIPALLQLMPADNAYDALANIPGIVASDDGISFAGRGVTLIINGKASTLGNQQLIERLKAMPASMVAKAEVLMAAPAKYHVRGMAINIVTKDYMGQHNVSAQLQATWQQNRYAVGQVGGSLIYNNGPVSVDATYSFNDGESYGQVEHNANHLLADRRMEYHDMTRRYARGITHKYHLGIDYAISEDSRLSASYTGDWTSTHALNSTEGTTQSKQKTYQHNWLHNIDMSYVAPFGLQLGASYTSYQNPRVQHLYGSMYDMQTDIMVDSRQRIGKWQFTADQEHSLGKGWGINYGVQMQFANNNSYQTTTDADGLPVNDGNSSVDYDERILSIYGGVSSQLTPDISLEATVTSEHYHATLWDDWRMYPMFGAVWNANDNNIFNFALSSEVSYPSYWSTIGSVYYSSVYSEIWGNPTLRPSRSYDISLMWMWRQRFNFVAMASLQPDYFVQLPYQPDDRMAVIMKETNFDFSNTYSLQSSVQFNAGNWLNGKCLVSLLYRNDKSKQFFDLPFDRKRLTWIISSTTTARLLQKHNLSLTLSPFLQTRAIQGVYDIEPLFRLNASMRYTTPDNNWTLILSGNNITYSKARTRSRYMNQDYSMNLWITRPSVSLSLVYRIGSYKEKKRKAVDTSRMGY